MQAEDYLESYRMELVLPDHISSFEVATKFAARTRELMANSIIVSAIGEDVRLDEVHVLNNGQPFTVGTPRSKRVYEIRLEFDRPTPTPVNDTEAFLLYAEECCGDEIGPGDVYDTHTDSTIPEIQKSDKYRELLDKAMREQGMKP